MQYNLQYTMPRRRHRFTSEDTKSEVLFRAPMTTEEQVCCDSNKELSRLRSFSLNVLFVALSRLLHCAEFRAGGELLFAHATSSAT